MVCKDGLPLSAIESEGLKLLLKTTAPLYQVPGRKKLTSLLEKKDISLREVVKQQLTQAVWVSITTDLASVTPKGYLVVTGHFIDGGANIIGAVRKIMGGERSHVPCMAHLINLCVHQALSKSEKVTSVIEKVKLIVAYFQRNISASDALHAAQYKTGVLVPLELIQAVYTRWNSTFYSLERFTQLARCVSQVLLSGCHRTAPAMLTTEELAIVTDLVVVLSPFEDATNEVSGDKYMTASTVLPIVNCLHNTVAEASFVNEDIMALNDALLDQIVWRLLPLEDNYLLASATILDPRFKMVHFRSPMRSSKVLQWISREMRAVVNGNPYEDSNTQQRKVERPCVFGSLWNIHDRLTKQEAAAVELPGSSDELHPELKLYLKMPKVDRTQCPLKLWLDLEKSFPILARLAFKYLTVMGSSVASDSVVSHLNTTASDVRNRLSPAHINMLVFMSSLDYNTWFSEI
ncbi:E3 SUMO-protein ligase ZBED1-like isoform X2 [Portunus trituberculatus]|uniref:E3 SUMO-protein ligase ZBED1-like isoform X2 n=1 Tax=Portunus trituberculatus TaxID=210409 RepID=UPI001E1CDEE9|nr:E3 SUMO-protein ligase ZBED1-like isoform X2 [Portunus trituberculatus]